MCRFVVLVVVVDVYLIFDVLMLTAADEVDVNNS